ncbi:hypothetical protein P3T76_002434 [Phytophthora citrophthora]|uniref:Elicitin-like protein n=1 Tax=Phytophthora citrophthora TaxID=4793 RepID=A0AAD9LTY8_9STRA|nr:hypothetical protein P3T76_002434 [Phytophthora citrophthora]
MKTFFLALALALATTDSLVRADCTADDLAMIDEIYANAKADGPASCPTEAPTGNTDKYCEYAACLRGHPEIVDEIPNCIHEGFSLRDGLKAAFEMCEGISTDSSGTATSGSGTATSSSSSSTPASNSSTIAADSSTSTDASGSSGFPDSTTSSSASGNNIAADSGSASSSASTIALAASSVGVTMTAFIFAVGL